MIKRLNENFQPSNEVRFSKISLDITHQLRQAITRFSYCASDSLSSDPMSSRFTLGESLSLSLYRNEVFGTENIKCTNKITNASRLSREGFKAVAHHVREAITHQLWQGRYLRECLILQNVADLLSWWSSKCRARYAIMTASSAFCCSPEKHASNW